jgi:sugar O-acyltransferase (sialic acid O-acetyltransferase NeuD family)
VNQKGMTMTTFGVFGAGGCGRSVLPLVRDAVAPGDTVMFVDDGVVQNTLNGSRLSSLADFAEIDGKKAICVAVANSLTRQSLVAAISRLGIAYFEVVAREHRRMDNVVVGEGGLFSPFTVLTSNIQIGRHFHCNLYSYVEHDCVIGDFVTFAPGVCCNGQVTIGDRSYIGSNAVIRQGLTIGSDAVVGMGAVVTRDVPDGATVVGNPARLLAPSS